MYGHHRRQEDLDHRLKALRDAGLPEWSFNFRGRPEDRLDAAAIRTLAMDRTWIGHHQNGAPFVMQLSPNGDFALRAQTSMVVGSLLSKTTSSARNPQRSCSEESFAAQYTATPEEAPKRRTSTFIRTRPLFGIFLLLSEVRHARARGAGGRLTDRTLSCRSLPRLEFLLLDLRPLASAFTITSAARASKSSSRPSFPENRYSFPPTMRQASGSIFADASSYAAPSAQKPPYWGA